MRPEIFAIFIPIVFLIGLFTVIVLNILFKYKARELTANRTGSIDEWHKTDAEVMIAKAQARASRRHGTILCISGLLTGIGLGVAIGCIMVTSADFAEPVAVFLVIALALFFGGAGMVGAYFLERRLNQNSK